MTTESPRILLADDEDTFRKATATLLEQEGYRCDSAQDFEQASRLLMGEHDVLISDIRMPGNMQFEFLRDVRTRFPLLPIVLVTGYPSVQTAVEALRLGFTDYLLKPVDWPDLRRAVADAVKKTSLVRMTTSVREEASRLVASLEHLQETLPQLGSGANERELAWSLDTFLAQSFSSMAVLSSRIRSVLTSQMQGRAEAPTDVCRMMACPRLAVYREALEGTVEVLEKTKIAFRSKDLGLLRGKIEQLLREDA
ncbi:MAG: response regulator [Nitrospira sp.]|nr:MAG: response regulator [Nitrospira sp.]